MGCPVCGRETTYLFTSSHARSFCFSVEDGALVLWYGRLANKPHARRFMLSSERFAYLLSRAAQVVKSGGTLYAAVRQGEESIEAWLLAWNYHVKVQNYLCGVLEAFGVGRNESRPDRLVA